MTSIKRYVGAGSAAVLLAFSLTACGDDGSDAPDNASKEKFCDAYSGQLDAFSDIDPESSESEQAKALVDGLKKWADELEKVGTPDGISDEEREGFEITIKELGDLDADDVEKAIKDGDSDFAEVSKDDEKKANAFNDYATKECGAPEAPTE
jgi:hypothetical protein